jgi:alpha,alpha-trehalose phosphorylase
VIHHGSFPAEPWAIRETELQLDELAQRESVFALANGHIGLRGNLDEGEPFGLPGTYLAGFYEVRPLPYGESAYGYPEAGQTIVNVTNGKLIRLLVEDEPFDVRYGVLERHERVLDLRAGVLRRICEWSSPAHTRVRVTSTRLVSFTQRAVAAIAYEVEPLDGPTPVVVQSELVANEDLPVSEDDPRAAAAMASPLRSLSSQSSDSRAVMMHVTNASNLTIGAAMDHVVDGPDGTDTSGEAFPDVARLTVVSRIAAGKPLRLVKFIAYGWSSSRSVPAIRDQVAAALAEARHTGWEGLLAEQRQYLGDFWDRADVEVQGDAELQQAARFALFHTLQAGARAEQRAIGAKGLTGPGYDGHTFWDTETFVLPVLTYTAPQAAADALRWRQSTLDLACERAAQLGLNGSAFPWRTIRGQECSGYWPAGTAAFHVNSDIADAVSRYCFVTADEAFERDIGLELLVETARLWRSLGHHDSVGRFRIDGVTGPDEYSALADNNVYTNLMAQHNLRAAADAADRHRARANALGVDNEELAAWRDAANDMLIPYDADLGVHPQAEEFTDHQPWDFASTTPDQYPLMLHFHYFELYRKQVVKQADLVLALHRRGEAFTDEEKARDFAYYERLTVRDSSLSAAAQAVVAAEVGHMMLAYAYLRESALMDLDDLQHNTRNGLHIASLAGTWFGLVAGLGGLRDHSGTLSFAPRLPPPLTGLTFRLSFRGRRLKVDVSLERATYSLLQGHSLQIAHHGDEVRISPDKPLTLPIPAAARHREAPTQPPGRSPEDALATADDGAKDDDGDMRD